ncbi:MAG: hypothetical protein E6R14_05360 [Thermomicrobiales bacterium]|nr:MAG: hypothetical protein E6R14_05360 [Thermomicrobiales bacterium]
MKTRTFASLATATLLSLATTAAQANLLSNGGFETGDFSGWTLSGNPPLGHGVGSVGQVIPDGVYGPGAVMTHGGSFAAWAVTRGYYGEELRLSQTLQLAAGDYSAGFFYASNTGPYGNAMKIYLDGVALASGGPDIGPSFLEQTAGFSLASAGSHTLSFVISGSGFGPGPFSADDFYLTSTSPVPEPSSAALLVVGRAGLWSAGRLRRARQ